MMKAANLNPRNDGYIFNLAGLCLAVRKFDDAIKLLETLQVSSSPEIAAEAGQALAGARESKRAATSNFDAGPRRLVLELCFRPVRLYRLFPPALQCRLHLPQQGF
jgi:hypothetical protein